MRASMKILAVSASIILGLGLASGLYAHESGKAGERGGSMMGKGMMGQGGMMGSMTGQQMMDHCGQMMQGSMGGGEKPNERWRNETPKAPKQGG